MIPEVHVFRPALAPTKMTYPADHPKKSFLPAGEPFARQFAAPFFMEEVPQEAAFELPAGNHCVLMDLCSQMGTYSSDNLARRLHTSPSLCFLNLFGRTSFIGALGLSAWWSAATWLFDLLSHPVDALWETVAMPFHRPQRASFGFLLLASLLGNASCSDGHHCGRPFLFSLRDSILCTCYSLHCH